MKSSVCLEPIFIDMALMLILFVGTAHAETASVYGGRDGYCGSRTANEVAALRESDLYEANE